MEPFRARRARGPSGIPDGKTGTSGATSDAGPAVNGKARTFPGLQAFGRPRNRFLPMGYEPMKNYNRSGQVSDPDNASGESCDQGPIRDSKTNDFGDFRTVSGQSAPRFYVTHGPAGVDYNLALPGLRQEHRQFGDALAEALIVAASRYDAAATIWKVRDGGDVIRAEIRSRIVVVR